LNHGNLKEAMISAGLEILSKKGAESFWKIIIPLITYKTKT